MSHRIDEIVDNSDWLLGFIFLKLPAVFAAGELQLLLMQAWSCLYKHFESE